jgi:NAD+--dinitrogen-reductase ADP-D-ribosyltransferase
MDAVRPLTTMCNLPPWEISSQAYNENPQPLFIQGVRTTHQHFFRLLDPLEIWEERARI